MPFQGVSGGNSVRLLPCPTLTATQDPRGVKVEFHQVASRGKVVGVQLDRQLELVSDPPRQQETMRSFRLQSIRPPKPEVGFGRGRIEIDGPRGVNGCLVVLGPPKVTAR